MTKREAAASLIDCIERLGPQKVAKFCDDGFKGSYVILKAVRLGEGTLRAADLARALHVSTARITVALNSLEQKGQIRRERGGGRTVISLTPKGAEQMQAQENRMVEQVTQMMANLSEDEAEQLVNLVRKL